MECDGLHRGVLMYGVCSQSSGAHALCHAVFAVCRHSMLCAAVLRAFTTEESRVLVGSIRGEG